MGIYKHFPILIIDSALDTKTGEGQALQAIISELEDGGFAVIKSFTIDDGIEIITSYKQVPCILMSWDKNTNKKIIRNFIKYVRSMNETLPIFIMTERKKLSDIDLDILNEISGYIWKMNDTANFIAGRIEVAISHYLKNLAPPFFKELVCYIEEFKYAWHTPGHMGGEAFQKSPIGRAFFDFFGETVFRADLSVSVPELGSLMEHSGVTGEAERQAAENFGADQTYFVTNGTSTANKIVLCGTVTPGDVVLVDRNCHKSLQHALTMTGAIPVYFIPTRNAYGIIGGIHQDEFNAKNIKAAIRKNPLIKNKNVKPKLAVITNSTYDGLLYDVVTIKDKLSETVDAIHFDEAWYAYAKFHELYDNRYGMGKTHAKHHPAIFATQSTHKLLAAFSQASMVHVKSGVKQIDPARFNEAFMMHTSTSPQYTIIASLDVANKMMQGPAGRTIINEAVEEAVIFRKKVAQIKQNILLDKKIAKKAKWSFDVWQPDFVKTKGKQKNKLLNTPDAVLTTTANCWHLNKTDKWHGYPGLKDGYMMLDPIKVSIVTPGINPDGTMANWGIPAPILATFLISRGIVDEKTGFYTFLLLFSIGVCRAKSGTLLVALQEFKKLYDQNKSIQEMLPELVEQHPERYNNVSIQDFAQEMHGYLKSRDITNMTTKIFSILPPPAMTPADAYHELVRGKAKDIPLAKVKNRTAAVMLVPYPPGIPIIMPGETFDKAAQGIIDYLQVFEDFDNQFPGFETETHGIVIKTEKGRKKYYVPCIE
jgi:arginine decarboxylase